MARICYDIFYDLLYPLDLQMRDQKRKKSGEEIFSDARSRDFAEKRRISSGISLFSRAFELSAFATDKTSGLHFIPGDSEYKNPTLELALQFALENNDRKLYRELLRLDKYMKEAYEASYKIGATNLNLYESSERSIDNIEKQREKLAFIHQNAKKDSDYLYKLMQEKKERLSSTYISEKEKEKLTTEISLIEEMLYTSGKRRKRLIVAKEKEINEVIASAQKNQGYKNRYIRNMRSKQNWKIVNKTKNKYYSSDFEVARDVLWKLRGAIDVTWYERDENGREIKSHKPIFNVDQVELVEIKKQLQEKYYPNKNTKAK